VGWGSSKSNFAGITLNDYLLQSPFVMLNDGSGTKISANVGYISCPDITLVCSSSLNFSWRVYDDPIDSNHLPIEINFNYGGDLRSYKFQHKRPTFP